MQNKTDKLIYRGKSKDVFEIREGKYQGKYKMVFTDRATGYKKAGQTIFDPGYDNVVGSIPGKGKIACQFTTKLFRLLKEKHIPTHYIETVSDDAVIVEPAIPISMKEEAAGVPGSAPLVNLEFTWRNNNMGSFWRRYPFVRPCKNLNFVVEAWTKGKSDILITFESLVAAGVVTRSEIKYIEKLVKKIASIVTIALAQKNIHAIDGKFELGRLKHGGKKIVLIDEISCDVLRVCKGFLPDRYGNCMIYRQCIKTSYKDGVRTIQAKNQLSAKQLLKIFL